MERLMAQTVDLDRLDILTNDPALLPETNPIAGAKPSKTPAAFFCTGQVCRAPVFAPDALADLLARSG